MKKVLLSLSICMVVNSLTAQCNISNSSFETWQPDSVSGLLGGSSYYERPEEWSPFLSLLIGAFSGIKPGIYKSTDAYAGKYSVELRADPLTTDSVQLGGDLLTVLPCSSNPAAFTGYMSTEGFDNSDSVIISVAIMNDNGDTLGQGFTELIPNTKTWSAFSCPIEYESLGGKSASIWLLYIPKKKNVTKLKSVKFDGFAFSGVSAVNDTQLQSKLAVFPNPFKDQLTLQNVKEGDLLKVYDMLGHEVLSFTATSNDPNISMSHLENGIYFIERKMNGSVARVKVMKN